MGMLTNQIHVLLQRVKMAGREPHKIIMHQGLKETLMNEIRGTSVRLAGIQKVVPMPEVYNARQGAIAETFEGIPIVVDNSIGEILVQVKPLPYATKDIVSKVPWAKILKMKRF